MSNYRPPAVQGATGLKADADFNKPEPGIVERFVGYWRGHGVYRERPPKATWVRDPRAVQRERLLAERRDRLMRSGVPIHTSDDGTVELDPPRATILPAAKRGGSMDADPGDWIITPPRGNGESQ